MISKMILASSSKIESGESMSHAELIETDAVPYEIVLATPPFSLKEDYGNLDFVGGYGPVYNLVLLATTLEDAKVNSRIIDFSYQVQSLEECAWDILKSKPKFVGIAVHFTFLANRALKLIAEVKRLDPNVIIFAGGIHFSTDAMKIMEDHSAIDIGFLGEAELTIVEVVKKLRADQAIDDVQGVIFRKGDQLVKVGDNQLVEDINNLPFPRYDKVDFGKYANALNKRHGSCQTLSIVTSRGCPYKCSFCDRSLLGNSIRYHDQEYIAKLIDHMVENFGVTNFNLEDENFCISLKRLKSVCEVFKEKHEKYGVTFLCAMRADRIFPDTGKILYEAGCRTVQFGFESGSQKMLDSYAKNMNVDKISLACKRLKNTGVNVNGSFIIGGPGEDQASINDTVKLVKKLNMKYLFLWYFVPIKGSSAFRNIHDNGVVIGDDDNRTGHKVAFIPNGLTKKEVELAYKRIYRAFYLRPSSIFTIVQSYGFRGLPRLFINGMKFIRRFVFV